MPPLVSPSVDDATRCLTRIPLEYDVPSLTSPPPLSPSTNAQVVGDWTSGVSSVDANSLCSTAGYFFDPMGLECNQCPSGSSVDGFGCACHANSRWIAGTGVAPYGTCEACDTNEVLSWDNTTCMACDSGNGATLNSAKTECVCLNGGASDDTTYVVVEFDTNGERYAAGKRCVQCPEPSTGKTRLRDATEKGKCYTCPQVGTAGNEVQMTWDAATKTCSCPSGLADCYADATKKSSLTAAYSTVTFDSTANTLVYESLGASIQSATVISDWFASNLI